MWNTIRPAGLNYYTFSMKRTRWFVHSQKNVVMKQILQIHWTFGISHCYLMQNFLNSKERYLAVLHSKKESAHWAVDVTAQMYACWLSGWLRCNFWIAFILSVRLYIYIWPIKNSKNVGLIKLTGVEWIITANSMYLLLRCTYAPQWGALRRELTQLTLCTAVKWRNTQSCLRWR